MPGGKALYGHMAEHSGILHPAPVILGTGHLSGLETVEPKMADMGLLGALGAALKPNEEEGRDEKVICLNHAI